MWTGVWSIYWTPLHMHTSFLSRVARGHVSMSEQPLRAVKTSFLHHFTQNVAPMLFSGLTCTELPQWTVCNQERPNMLRVWTESRLIWAEWALWPSDILFYLYMAAINHKVQLQGRVLGRSEYSVSDDNKRVLIQRGRPRQTVIFPNDWNVDSTSFTVQL